MTTVEQLVSVVIPAYNSEATILETLRSVQAQTYRELEVIVVNDGSCDATARIATEFAAEDPRFRIVDQANAGVAAARNTGWRQARADLVAFVDADDLWANDKIGRQVAALRAAGPRCGLVYVPYAQIDERGTVIYLYDGPLLVGAVLDDLLVKNFVGNGSSALVRKEVLEKVGGFEPGLRAARAQGCEDLLFYRRVAEHFEFAAVGEHLVGYRQLSNAMSSDMQQMFRSWILADDELAGRHPAKRAIMRKGLRKYGAWLVHRAVANRRPQMVLPLVRLMLPRDPAFALRMAVIEPLVPFAARTKARILWRLGIRRDRLPPALPPSRFATGGPYAWWESAAPAVTPADARTPRA